MYDLELNWLKRFGWLFSVVGIPLGCLLDGVLWAAVTLDSALLPETFSGWVTAKGIALGVAIGLIPLIWRVGLAVERRWGEQLRRIGAAPIGVLIVYGMAELGLRSNYGQSLLWQSVRSRAADNFFAREVALFRLDHTTIEEARPGVVVAGSSQMLHALDAPKLADCVGAPVYRRAVAGMFPVELCAAAGFLDFNSANRLLLMLSGFDIGARDRIYPDAVRPLATPLGVRLLRDAADIRILLHHWRFFVDVHVAALTDWWRSRDFIRMLLERPFGARKNLDKSQPDDGANQREAYLALGKNTAITDYSIRLMEAFFERMSPRFDEIIVVEGRLNPAYPGRDAEPLHDRARSLALDAERRGEIRYYPLEAQQVAPTPSDWLDMAHVNEHGRAVYTELFAHALTHDTVQ